MVHRVCATEPRHVRLISGSGRYRCLGARSPWPEHRARIGQPRRSDQVGAAWHSADQDFSSRICRVSLTAIVAGRPILLEYFAEVDLGEQHSTIASVGAWAE